MYKHEDCGCKSKKYEYARAYIIPQEYENLYSCKEGFLRGTIFKDLYRPYHHHGHNHHDMDQNYAHDYEYKKIKVER